jgi:hypothetical protein
MKVNNGKKYCKYGCTLIEQGVENEKKEGFVIVQRNKNVNLLVWVERFSNLRYFI